MQSRDDTSDARTGAGEGSDPKPGVQPKLVFKPDQRKTARIALFRRVIIWLAIAILVSAVLLVATYRPPPPTASVPETGHTVRQVELQSAAGRNEPESEGVEGPAVSREDVTPVSQAVRFVNEIDRAGRLARELWGRADAMLPGDVVMRDASDEAIRSLRSNLALLDTAALHLADAAAYRLRMVDAASSPDVRDPHGFSVLRVAADKYLELLSEEAVEQRLLFDFHLASARAVARGDAAEAEIKFNVATSHRRKSEKRSRRLDRRAGAVRDALLHLRR
jgi:hypothetical protein